MSQSIQNYKRDVTERQNGIDALHRIAGLYKEVELAATAYRKDRTLANADKLMEAMYGLITRKDNNLGVHMITVLIARRGLNADGLTSTRVKSRALAAIS